MAHGRKEEMKSLILVLAFFCVAECQETQHKSKKHTHSSVRAAKPQEITSDQYSIIVPDSWMQEYKRLEKGRMIPEDSTIWQEGARYHISREVAQNYINLKKHEH